jgi:hypothetical protein
MIVTLIPKGLLLNVKAVVTHQAFFDSASSTADEFRDMTRPYLRSRLGSSVSGKRASRHDGELGGIRRSTLSGIRPRWRRCQKGARLGDNAILELRVAHERGAEHRMAALVVVDTGLTGCSDQDLGDHARCSLRSPQYLDEGHEQRNQQRNDVFLQKAHRGTDIGPA